MPEVSVVIVCMNRPDILFPCLDGIKAHTTVSYETLVVAYNFSEGNLSLLKEKYPWVTVIESSGVKGFADNNNIALKKTKGRYCFVVNDDTLMDMPVIDRLYTDLEMLGPKAAAVSPKIVFPDGRVQTCGRAPWTPWRYAMHYLHLVDETKPSQWSMKDGLFRTYTLNGACFMARSDVFRGAGFFDERFFFTPEDIALGHQFNDMGCSVWTDSDVVLTHIAGGSVSKMEAAIKPARVRGSMVFYGEPFFLKLFIWCFEALRGIKYVFMPRTERNLVMRATARNVRRTVFAHETPKEIFIQLTKTI